MATEPTPTDAEIDEIYRATFHEMPKVARQPPQTVPPMVRDFARAVLARWGAQPAPAASPVQITRAWVDEVRQYLVAAADSSMSRNNSEQLASELLDQMPQATAAPVPLTDQRAEQALRKVLSVVQRYLPPDGPSAKDALSEIIAIVDPWPLGKTDGITRGA